MFVGDVGEDEAAVGARLDAAGDLHVFSAGQIDLRGGGGRRRRFRRLRAERGRAGDRERACQHREFHHACELRIVLTIRLSHPAHQDFQKPVKMLGRAPLLLSRR